jgi:hypothetical protein
MVAPGLDGNEDGIDPGRGRTCGIPSGCALFLRLFPGVSSTSARLRPYGLRRATADSTPGYPLCMPAGMPAGLFLLQASFPFHNITRSIQIYLFWILLLLAGWDLLINPPRYG